MSHGKAVSLGQPKKNAKGEMLMPLSQPVGDFGLPSRFWDILHGFGWRLSRVAQVYCKPSWANQEHSELKPQAAVACGHNPNPGRRRLVRDDPNHK